MSQRSLFFAPIPMVPVIAAMAMLVTPVQALAQILPQNNSDNIIMINYCGGPPVALDLGDNKSSEEPQMPDNCCKIACHAALDRKKKERDNECC